MKFHCSFRDRQFFLRSGKIGGQFRQNAAKWLAVRVTGSRASVTLPCSINWRSMNNPDAEYKFGWFWDFRI
jgi:hypothetical protein